MTDTLRLKAAIVQSGMTINEVAKKIGLSSYGFYKKLHNITEFKASEIDALVKLLKLTDKDAYFFAQNVELKSTQKCGEGK